MADTLSGSITRKDSNLSLVASAPKSLSHKSLNRTPVFNNGNIRKFPVSDVALFLLKVGALETIRRLSKAKCPYVWSGLQALQVFCYPPLKWLQRWHLFRNLIKGAQILARPLLLLSIATAFSDQLGFDNTVSDDSEISHIRSDSHVDPQSHSELPSVQPGIGEAQSHQLSADWLVKLYRELDNQGISLPERINEDELCRFYSAANGDFSCLMTSVKKAIRWRETYRILSGEELEIWSNMVFWHGFDLKNRPCLIVRLVACINLPPTERPRFAQAIVSQVEHGILHLVDSENPQITVLVDCEGLSLRFPMQVLRSCAAILQDNYPNRLGCLFVIRLPPVGRVIAQTFIQVLKPTTRQKLKIIGRMYQNALSEYLQAFPSYLGGECTCSRCAKLSNSHAQTPQVNELTRNTESNSDTESTEDLQTFGQSHQIIDLYGCCDRVLRNAVVGVLIIWVFIAFIAGISDPESRSGLPN